MMIITSVKHITGLLETKSNFKIYSKTVKILDTICFCVFAQIGSVVIIYFKVGHYKTQSPFTLYNPVTSYVIVTKHIVNIRSNNGRKVANMQMKTSFLRLSIGERMFGLRYTFCKVPLCFSLSIETSRTRTAPTTKTPLIVLF